MARGPTPSRPAKNTLMEVIMKVKIVAEMSQEEKDTLLSKYPKDWTIEEIIFCMVAPEDEYSDIDVIIIN